MIRALIIIVIAIVGAVMFLPQTVAAFPSLDGVIGALSKDIAGVRDGAISWVTESISGALTGALSSVGSTIMSTLPG